MPAELDALVALMPFAAQLGVILEEASPDRVTARLPWAPGLCTADGILHGGVLMSLADSAGALVAFLGLAEGSTTATITSTTQMFRPVSSGTVRAVALPLAPRPHDGHRANQPARLAGPPGSSDDPGSGHQALGRVTTSTKIHGTRPNCWLAG
jgi:1,4-dihydroxy-2-naphthoyl-CoA hydrolase